MRVQVNLSDEMVEKVDFYAKQMGVSRSALCSMFIGQGVMAFNKSFDIFSSIGSKIGDNFLSKNTLNKISDDDK